VLLSRDGKATVFNAAPWALMAAATPASEVGQKRAQSPIMAKPRVAAQQSLQTYLLDPHGARTIAERAFGECLKNDDLVGASIAQRALGLIAGHLADSNAASTHLAAAIKLATRGGDSVRAAQARTDLAYVLVRRGNTRAALRQIEVAGAVLRGTDAGRLHMMHALVLKRLGRLDDALEAYQRAMPLVRRSGDKQQLAELLGNRGVIYLHRAQLRKAERDLNEAAGLLAAIGAGFHQAITEHNLGCIASLRGDVPEALRRFDQAEAGYSAHREIPVELWRDRCELLLSAGLTVEARTAAQQAMSAASARHEAAEVAEAQIWSAQAALAARDHATAVAEATSAARLFSGQRRAGLAAFARWILIQAEVASPGRVVSVARVRRVAADLDRAGFNVSATDARLTGAAMAAATGSTRLAHRDLAQVAALPAAAPIWNRMQAWHAKALRAMLDKDLSAARRAAARGLDLADEYRASLGATDLQALAGQRVSTLAELGLRAALTDQRPRTILAWAERTRAAHLLVPRVRPPDDVALAADLSELRQLISRRLEAIHADITEQRVLIRRQVELERAVRDRARRAPGRSRERTKARTRFDLAADLGDRALVEFITIDGEIHAVTVVAGRVAFHQRIAKMEELQRELTFLPVTIRRLARPGVRDQVIAASLRTFNQSTRTVDQLLFRSLAPLIGDRALVIVPPAAIQMIPWSQLPSCLGRAVSIAPSAALWRAAANRTESGNSRVLLVSGPGLEHAETEVRALAAIHPDATVLTGEQAAADAVLDSMDAAALVHIAAHGDFRADQPMFSSVLTSTGPLTMYDIERLGVGPALLVLSACQAGRTAPLAGGDVLGLATALFRAGGSCLISSVIDIPDAEAASLMIEFHRRLGTAGPAQALAAAQQIAASGTPQQLAVAAAFSCFGAG